MKPPIPAPRSTAKPTKEAPRRRATWTVTTAEIGSDEHGGQVFKRGRSYFARAWDHRTGYGPMMAMVSRATLKGACHAVERWLASRRVTMKRGAR